MAEADEMSSASAHEPANTRRPATRRMLGPFGRSSTLKSGSLQDLKSAHGKLLVAANTQQAPHQQPPSEPTSLVASVRPKLVRQRSSQAAQARPQRNPFRSSKSMLLLAQNQHIPQASAQLDCFMTRQQVDFLNYAQLAASSQGRRPAQLPIVSHADEQLGLWPQDASQQLGYASAAAAAAANQQPQLNVDGSQQSLKFANQPAASESTSSGCNALSSEQCNEQEHEERPSCMHIMKKLFFSLLLGTLIALCWLMIIHTLKWIAIRGNEYELLQAQQTHYVTGAAGAAATGGAPLEQTSGQQQALKVLQQEQQRAPIALPIESDGLQSARKRRNPRTPNHQLATNERLARRARDEINNRTSTSAPGTQISRRQVERGSLFLGAAEEEERAEEEETTDERVPLAAMVTLNGKPEKRPRKPNLDDKTSTMANHSAPSSMAAGNMRAEASRASVMVNELKNGSEKAVHLVPAPEELAEEALLEGVATNEPVERISEPASVPAHSGESQLSGLVYRAPFFTSWFVSIWNILFMPVFTLISSCCFRNEDSTTKKLLVESISQFMDNGLTTLQFLGRCAFFSVLWIGTIFGIVYSLAHLDATVVMALFACSAALVYLLSWVLLHQQFVGVRIVAVIICTTGIALLAYMDNSRTLGSVLIVAGSALCSAVYKVIYQRMFGFWSIAQMSLFFTLIGLFNAFLMWPIALLLYFLGAELIVWRHIPWMHLIAAGALHLTANIVAYFGPICSYDIFLTLGLLLAVVLSAVIDVTFYKITFFGMKLAGVLLLMIGFLVCLLPENWNEYLYDLANERFTRWKKQRSLKKNRNKVQDMSTGQMSRLRTPSGRVK